jgi:thymidylate synthase (FAD)
MPQIVPPQVKAIAWTHFETPEDVPWQTDADGGQALAEFAGRACYQSWSKPNASTATNAGYLKHIIEIATGTSRTRSSRSAMCPNATRRWSSRM